MSSWTARIALIAYVVGGWLLPSAHFHGHHAPSGFNACQLDPTSNHTKVGPACSHHGQDCNDSVFAKKRREHVSHRRAEGSEDPGSGYAVNGSPSQDLGGLCGLCLARSLAKSPGHTIVLSSNGQVPSPHAFQWHQKDVPAQRITGITSRGPPAIQ